jgi:nitroreductase
MPVMDAIYGRRSVRSYLPQQPDAATIRTLLEAAVHAPTAIHEEPWAFAVIQDRALLHALSERAKPALIQELQRAQVESADQMINMLASPEFNIFYDAGTLIAIYGKPMGPFVVADCWLAAENLLLAAHALGLGTCVLGFAVAVLNTTEVKAELGIPAELTAVAPIIVGVPRGYTPATGRKAPEILVWK